MKKLLSLAAVALLLCVAACNNKGYKVTGYVTGAENGDTVILADVRGMNDVDTLQTVVVKGGKFVFEGVQDTAVMRYVIWRSNNNPDLALATQFALENGSITIKLDTAQNKSAEISGTPANEALSALSAQEYELNQKAQRIFGVLNDLSATDEAKADAEKQLNELQDQSMDIYRNFIKENIDNVVGQTYLVMYAGALGDDFVNEQLALIPESGNNEDVQSLRELYALKAVTAVGKPFKDIKAKTPEGNDLSVSEVAANAKVLLIDFWASWCGPCRGEMPNVKAAYEQYHAQGFEIIGVSLDKDVNAWKQAIAELGITWPQISDLKGWDCEGAGIYGVRAIPATVLIKDGKIVARDLRGDKLAEKVGELLQ